MFAGIFQVENVSFETNFVGYFIVLVQKELYKRLNVTSCAEQSHTRDFLCVFL
jgi:hypothetical protein